MPYTLTKGLLWFLLALLLGVAIGWLLRSIRATSQIRAARRAALASVQGNAAAPADADARTGQAAQHAATGAAPGTDGEATGDGPETTVVDPAPPLADVADPTDLTAIDGIDAAVAARCRSIGIVTWSDLAATEVSLLRTMLAEAGPEFADRDPATWPAQAAALLATQAGPTPSAP